MDDILGNCSPLELAKRKSFKWRTYPADVLPAFVAEMDYTLVEPISDAITAAMAIGDTGYPHVGELGEAFASFASGRLGWTPRRDWVFAVPDVRPGRRVPRPRPGGAQPRPGLRQPGRRVRPAQHRHVARAGGRGGAPDGGGDPGRTVRLAAGLVAATWM